MVIPIGIYWVTDLLSLVFYIHYLIISLQQHLGGHYYYPHFSDKETET